MACYASVILRPFASPCWLHGFPPPFSLLPPFTPQQFSLFSFCLIFSMLLYSLCSSCFSPLSKLHGFPSLSTVQHPFHSTLSFLTFSLFSALSRRVATSLSITFNDFLPWFFQTPFSHLHLNFLIFELFPSSCAANYDLLKI